VLRAANAAKDSRCVQITSMDPSNTDSLSRSQVEALYLKYIIPLPTKDEEDSVWTERLLLVLHYIVEEKNKMTLLNLTNLHLTLANALLPSLSSFDIFPAVPASSRGSSSSVKNIMYVL